MSLNFYYVDFWGNKCWVDSSCVSKASDGCWYDQSGHKCISTLDGYVEGTAGSDLIGATYSGDPEGDKIDHNDAVLGTAKSNDDIVYAYGGNDTVVAGEGHDTVYGGEGNDQLFGGNGNDNLQGEAGNDTLSGGAGANALYGGTGDDRFIGGAGADTFLGGSGQDNIDYSASTGGVSVNLSTGSMAGGEAANDVNGGGIDGVIGSNQADSLTGFDGQGTGSDTFTNQFWGRGGNDTISGLGGNDVIYGGADADTLSGGSGDDFVAGDQGNDLIDGGTGNDTLYGDLSSAAAASPVTITLTGDNGAYDCKLFAYSIDPKTGAISNIQILNAHTGTGIGTSYSYTVAPGTVVGVGIVSPDGTYYSSGYGSRIGLNGDGAVHTKGLGVDANGAVNIGFEDMKALGDKDFNDVTVKVDLGTSGASFDNAHYTYTSTAPLDAGAGADTITGGEGNDLIYGGAGNDLLSGGKDDDTVQGGSGDDTISGGAGRNVLSGGDDRDLFLGASAGDRVDGGEGGTDQDTLDLRGLGPVRITYDASNPENGTVEFLDAWGGTVTGSMTFVNIETVLKDAPVRDGYVDGTAGNDLIDGAYTGDPQGDRVDANDALLSGAQPNDDVIRAGAGDDTVRAGLGNDLIYGGIGNDSLEGGVGEDTLLGEAGEDKLFGGDGRDGLDGGAGNDSLDGGIGDDTLIGGAGRDSLIGGEGNDLIESGSAGSPDIALPGSTGDADPNDDRDLIDAGAGNDTIRSGDDADTIYGGAGDDSIDGGNDADLVDAGSENDTVLGGEGSDTIEGGAGDDLITAGSDSAIPDATDPAPGNDRDLVHGGAGNDRIYGGDDRDTLYGDAGNDTVDGGIDDDSLFGGEGRDLLLGGEGNDVIDSSSGDAAQRPDIAYPGLYPADTDPLNDRDTVYGGAGDDVIRSGDDADSLFGGEGRDLIDGGVDDDTIYGEAGNDTIIGAEGSDLIDAGTGDDLVYGGYGPGVPDAVNIPDASDLAPQNGLDLIHGGAGNDTLYGMDDRDTIYGGSENDLAYGGIDADSLFGGTGNDQLFGDQGNDTLSGDAEADSLYGGDDRDTFTGLTAGDRVDGGEGGDDYDTLNLTGAGPLRILYDSTNPENGTVEFLDAQHHVTGSLTFQNIENVIPCFTPGTLIATPRGEVAVENLRAGDRIITRDNGMQEIAWVGRRDLSWADLKLAGHLKPVLVRAGSLGNGLPERDMLVSPNHRLLVANDRTALYFDEHEVLVAAKHLTGLQGVMPVEAAGVSYIHFMCERHEVVLSDGAWTETFQPGDQTLKGMGNAQRSEIFDLFPELKTETGLETYQSARKTLKRHEAAFLWR
jgi:Ca2+-binding RTX toxin-like protein